MDAHELSPNGNKRKHNEISGKDLHDAGPSNSIKKKSTNTSSGIHCGLLGNEYQILVTMYVLLRVYNKYRPETFELRMERTDAGKFDDIWIKVKGEELFIQVKHETAKSNLTKGMLLPGTKKGRDEGAFSLYKYCESFSKLNKCCVLLTNKSISKDALRMLQPFKGRSLFTKLFGKTGQHYRVRNDSSVIGDLNNFTSIDSFCKMFLLSANHVGTEDFQAFIQDEVENLVDENAEIVKEDAEHVFTRLRGNLVNFICNKDTRLTSIRKSWIIEFINKINEDYKCITNAYYHEFIDRMQMHSQLTIKQDRMMILKDYLINHRILLLKYENTHFLRLLQSYQLVKEKPFTFVLFSRLNNTATRTKFQNALKSGTSKRSDLLILVDDADDENSVMDWIWKVPKATTKLIFISRNADELKQRCEQRSIPTAIENEEITLADLSEESKAEFLYRKIFFQGFEIKLGDMPALDSLQHKICETRLEQLVRGEPLEIGSKLLDITRFCSFYIPRTFTVQLAFLYDVDELRCIKQFLIKSLKFEFKPGVEVNDKNQFSDVSKINDGTQTIHVINSSNQYYNMLKWNLRCKQYFGSVAFNCSEKEIFQHSPTGCTERVKILSGEIGTGKSTTWVQLANFLKESDTSMWVVFINLSDEAIQTQLNAYLNAEVTEELVTTLLAQAVARNSWEMDYFRVCLKTAPCKVSVFLDGFDEICPSYKKIVIEIIKRLSKMSVLRIFVSLRLYMEKELEKEFLTTAYHLEPLNKDEQILLIKNIWSEQGHPEADIDNIAQQLVQKLERFMSVNEFNYFSTTNIGAPLAIKMVANLSRHQVEDFLMDHYTIYDLFDDFVQQIFKRFCIEKRKIQLALNSNMIEELDMKRSFYHKLNLFAMKWLYTPEDLNNFLTVQERIELQELSAKPIEETTVRELIIYSPRFIHRSYAEYFVASIIYKKFTELDDVNYFWTTFGRVLHFDEKDLVGLFFVYQFERVGCKNVKSSKVAHLLNLISTDPAEFVCKHRLPNCFRTYLINNSTKRPMLTDFAIKYNRLEMIKILINHGYDEYELLNKAILQNRQILVQYLVGDCQHLNRRDPEGLTLLHKAAKVGNINIALELIRKGAGLNVQDSSGYTPILLAYKHRQFYMASFLSEQSSREVTGNLESFLPFVGLRTDIQDNLLVLFLHFVIDNRSSTFKIIEQQEDYILLKIDERFIILVKELDLGRYTERRFIQNLPILISWNKIGKIPNFCVRFAIFRPKIKDFWLVNIRDADW